MKRAELVALASEIADALDWSQVTITRRTEQPRSDEDRAAGEPGQVVETLTATRGERSTQTRRLDDGTITTDTIITVLGSAAIGDTITFAGSTSSWEVLLVADDAPDDGGAITSELVVR